MHGEQLLPVVEMPGVVRFSGEFSRNRGEEIRHKLYFAIMQSANVLIDLADVSSVDLSGLQLICATHRKALESNVVLSLAPSVPDHVGKLAVSAGLPRKIPCVTAEKGEGCIWGDYAREMPILKMVPTE